MDDVVWYWDDSMDKKGIQGRYINCGLMSGVVVYKAVLATSGLLMPSFMVGTAAHELRHAEIAYESPALFTLTRGIPAIQHKMMGCYAVEAEANTAMGHSNLNTF